MNGNLHVVFHSLIDSLQKAYMYTPFHINLANIMKEEAVGAMISSLWYPGQRETFFLKFSFFPRTTDKWNSLPKDIVNATSVNSFKIFIDFLLKF